MRFFTKNNILLIIIFLLISSATFLLFKRSEPKLGFINIKAVFDKFDMKAEIERKYEKEKNKMKLGIDSVYSLLSITKNEIEQAGKSPDKDLINKFSLLRENYINRNKSYEENIQQLSTSYDKQIINRLNQYIADFGKENHYAFIIGNTESGNLMYGNEKYDITETIIVYANNRYKGLEK
jgi:outer membrane protein